MTTDNATYVVGATAKSPQFKKARLNDYEEEC